MNQRSKASSHFSLVASACLDGHSRFDTPGSDSYRRTPCHVICYFTRTLLAFILMYSPDDKGLFLLVVLLLY